MATTKTLAPTNQTITIAAFQGEKPDHRQVADAEGKLADAVNALNSQISYKTITDFNEFIPTGTTNKQIYGNSSGGSASNAPISGDNITYRAEAIGTTTYFTQEALIEYATTVGNRGRKFIRQCLNSEFTPWMEISERSLTQTIATNASKTFTISTYGMFLVKIGGYRDASCGVAYLCRSGTNTLVTKWLGTSPSNITISMSNDGNGTVTIANGDATSSINVWIERLTGTFVWN